MSKIQPVRGTHDFLPEQSRQYHHIVQVARSSAEQFGLGEIMTPVFEFTEVFHRTLGDTSDVVTKETYTFTDRGGESITLRPEFTAAVARAFLSNGLQANLPCKFFYAGPAFRYERPQKGRLRQFHQAGAEILGIAEPEADVEVIALGHLILQRLGIAKHTKLEINTLGDSESRANYREALVKYLSQHKESLSPESQARLERNPLRILDSKSEQDRAIVKGAPRLEDYLTDAARAFFTTVKEGLAALGIAFEVNDRLVRGLDYYCHTVFEFTTDALGAQNAVMSGGRYDQLITMMGGNETPGVGWACGIERLMALMVEAGGAELPKAPQPVVVIGMGDAAEKEALKLAYELRKEGFVVEQVHSGNMGKRMKKADKLNAKAVLILGEEELAAGEVTLRNMAQGQQERVKLADVRQVLGNY